MKIKCPKCHEETEFTIRDSISDDGEVFLCTKCKWPFRYVIS